MSMPGLAFVAFDVDTLAPGKVLRRLCKCVWMDVQHTDQKAKKKKGDVMKNREAHRISKSKLRVIQS